MKYELCFILLIMVINSVYIIYHEDSHMQIAKYHGCVGYERSFASFTCTAYIQRSDETKLQEELLHTQNEILGYHLLVVMNAILLSFFVILLKLTD